jgi:signal transduction histidine kinase
MKVLDQQIAPARFLAQQGEHLGPRLWVHLPPFGPGADAGTLAGAAAEGDIWIRARYGDQYSVTVTLTDNGPGIPPDKREQIFEAYFTTKVKGSGLGLAIVKHNVEIYGGSVRLESELGKGTTFTLQFPARTVLKLRK